MQLQRPKRYGLLTFQNHLDAKRFSLGLLRGLYFNELKILEVWHFTSTWINLIDFIKTFGKILTTKTNRWKIIEAQLVNENGKTHLDKHQVWIIILRIILRFLISNYRIKQKSISADFGHLCNFRPDSS